MCVDVKAGNNGQSYLLTSPFLLLNAFSLKGSHVEDSEIGP